LGSTTSMTKYSLASKISTSVAVHGHSTIAEHLLK